MWTKFWRKNSFHFFQYTVKHWEKPVIHRRKFTRTRAMHAKITRSSARSASWCLLFAPFDSKRRKEAWLQYMNIQWRGFPRSFSFLLPLFSLSYSYLSWFFFSLYFCPRNGIMPLRSNARILKPLASSGCSAHQGSSSPPTPKHNGQTSWNPLN